jgi:hypothetical protein
VCFIAYLTVFGEAKLYNSLYAVRRVIGRLKLGLQSFSQEISYNQELLGSKYF